MSKQKVIICHSINENLADAISQCTYDKLFILVDEHTRKLCIPLIQEAGFMKDAQLICIGAEAFATMSRTLILNLQVLTSAR